MLVIKAFVNERQIDEIRIRNVGGDPWDEVHKYRIEKPEGFGNIVIKHVRSLGYRPLLEKALKVLAHANNWRD